MYVPIGNDFSIREQSIVGIFDLENSTISVRTREFLTEAEKNGKIVNVSAELPKSFVVCQEQGVTRIYICQLLPGTLIKRASQMMGEAERKE